MAAPTVYNDVAEDFELEGVGQLFAGKKFWVALRMPSRNRLLDDIKANGGEIVALEKKADYRIADHFRRDCPPGSTSYEFVEKSIQEGRIRDPEDHRCGPPLGEAREPGAINRPARGGRAAYTADEDRILYKWVRDCEAHGGLASGNEIYKQLEAKYPRHTWQSWRDRYLKQLRTRPPSAFNIPDNAPPSPPSDHPLERPSVPSSSRQRKEAAPTDKKPEAEAKVSELDKAKGPAKPTEDYTVDQLAKTFTSDDWEELYAFVDIIEGQSGQERYDAAWEAWAESRGNQTVEQWRQYYEKVVRPQWTRDPEWKREQIRKKIESKHEGSNASPGQTLSQQQPQYLVGDENKISEPYQNVLKRVRGHETEAEHVEHAGSSRPPKRQKSTSPATDVEAQQNELVGTLEQPVNISSGESSTSASESLDTQERVNDQIMQDLEQTLVNDEAMAGRNAEEAEKEIGTVELDDFLDVDYLARPQEGLEESSDDDLPSNSPTPRAARQRASNFDTQAILSSPSQDIGRLLRPPGYPQETQTQPEQRSSSLAPHSESDASTTQSMQEFRRSLNGKDLSQRPHPTVSRPASPSPAPSSSSSTGSGDPDMPLEADEFDEFFDAQHEEGFSDEFIAKALKRTRCRPGLAEVVLEAWKNGEPLPNQRGIWSLEDDEAVESGDGLALAKLERKHTLDGWGGITERMIFLEQYRNR